MTEGANWVGRWESIVAEWLDSERRGRGLVESDAVTEFELRPGGASARIRRGRDAEPFVVDLGVVTFSANEARGLAERVAADPRWSAEIITGGLPQSLADTAGEGPGLLPSVAELSGECTCGEWTGVCDHVAAVGWYLADLVATDPFVLLTLRGIGRDELVRAARERRGASAPVGEPRDPDPGLDASEAFARVPQPLPRPLPVPWRAGEPIDIALAAPSDSGVHTARLRDLVADAAGRAALLLQGDDAAGLELSRDEDLVRRAVAADAEQGEVIAAALGYSLDELAVATRAWTIGGVAGLRVWRDRWEAPEDVLSEAAASLEGRVRTSHNVLSGPGFQLRLDQAGRWWRFRPDEELGWVVATEGFDDPADALDAPAVGEADLSR